MISYMKEKCLLQRHQGENETSDNFVSNMPDIIDRTNVVKYTNAEKKWLHYI